MLYLEKFVFPDRDAEFRFFLGQKLTCYDSHYPFQTLSARSFRQIDFEPITVLCGANGSGKSTALNVIAEKLRLTRGAPFNKTSFYMKYVDLCTAYLPQSVPSRSRVITSDDVFDYMLDVRGINDGVDISRDKAFEEYSTLKHSGKYSDFTMKSMEDYDTLKKLVRARSKTQSKYTRATVPDNVRTYSNGETAFRFFTEKIRDGGLYVLDEPENSLSPQLQMELAALLEDAARYGDCQFIIATHSVFLSAMRRAKVYDLDADPVDVKPWTELALGKLYLDFFRARGL